MNVLHAPLNIGSQASSLADAENNVRRRLGLPGKSWSVDFEPQTHLSAAHVVFPVPAGLAGRWHRAVRPFLYGLRHCREFDVLHLNFGKGLLRLDGRLSFVGRIDLPLWKAMGKRVFMTFQGCDARICEVSARRPYSPCQPGICSVPFCGPALDRKRRRWNAQCARWADKCFCLNPDLLQFVPGAEFLPYASYGEVGRRQPAGGPQRPLRVVHAPTKRAAKGTDIIMAASVALQASQPHELVIVENCPREEALRRYAEADVLVDQVRIGWYGGLAMEAMSMGVPVVAYLDAGDLLLIPAAMRAELPVVNASPDTLPAVLARLLDSPAERRELGERGMAFVRRWHHPVKIARRMLELYADPAQNFWDGYDPEGDV